MKIKQVVCGPALFNKETGMIELVNLRTEWTTEKITQVGAKKEFRSKNGLDFLAVGKVIEGAASLDLLRGISLNSYEFALFLKVEDEWRLVADSNLILSSPEELNDVSGKVIWFIKNNDMAILESPMVATFERLDKQVTPARPGMTPTKELLYSNEKTGTVVYRVKTSNTSLPYKVTEVIIWAYFLVGNAEGFTSSGCYVHSEANFSIGKITEDDKRVTIERSGKQTVHFGIEIDVENMVFEKADFKPYENGKLATA